MPKSTSCSKNKLIWTLQKKLSTTVKTHKRQNRNAIKGIDLNQATFQYFEGVDLMAIEGVSHATILSIMSEIGHDGFFRISYFQTFYQLVEIGAKQKKTGVK